MSDSWGILVDLDMISGHIVAPVFLLSPLLRGHIQSSSPHTMVCLEAGLGYESKEKRRTRVRLFAFRARNIATCTHEE